MNEVSANNDDNSQPDAAAIASNEVHLDVDSEARTPRLPAPGSNAKFTTYPQHPINRSYRGPTTTEIGIDAVQAGIDSFKTRCIIRIRRLSWRWKISLLLSITALILSIIITNTCKYVIVIRTYNDENLSTVKFGRGVVKGQLEPTDNCLEWFEYDSLDTCSKDTSPFTLSFVVMGIYIFESIMLTLAR
mmetsp:Transcript_7482/g.15656  ORF Transcript_7482/g.15656 Transcript_7482/m.15656 type:complete len:189 (-) Transcript_7482:2185-2751(-)